MPNKYEKEETKADVSLEEQHFPGVKSCARRNVFCLEKLKKQ